MICGDYLRLELLNRYGFYKKTLDESIDYFYKMAKISGTLWEHDSIACSLNDGFASFISHIIVEAVSGIKNIDRKNKVITVEKIKPVMEFSFQLPTKDGYINVEGKIGTININAPSTYKINY